MENLALYNAMRGVPQEAQKSFNNGRFSGTDINPMWRIKILTEKFGVAGFGWWTENVRYTETPGVGDERLVMCELELRVKLDGETSAPIYGIGGNTVVAVRKNGAQSSDEAYKMAYTDALGIAAKALGVGADIWFAHDKTKYNVDNSDAKSAQKKSTASTQNAEQPTRGQLLSFECRKAGIDPKLVALKIKEMRHEKADDLTEAQFKQLISDIQKGAVA
jgi:hypothetical protein